MMKWLETHFEDYVASVKTLSLHPELNDLYAHYPASCSELQHMIYYGPAGVGKYSQLLYSLAKYSPTDLKYERRMCVTHDKKPYYYKISDIHYEVDMSLLGCNAKLLWHDIYQHVVDIVSGQSSQDKVGIIVCKQFHCIHGELLDNFDSYMQPHPTCRLVFVLLTESISFIPMAILNRCQPIRIARPTAERMQALWQSKGHRDKGHQDIDQDQESRNIKGILTHTPLVPHRPICEYLVDQMRRADRIHMVKIRDVLYDLLIYHLNMGDCVWYWLTHLPIRPDQQSAALIHTVQFFTHYNNHYRPIYHLEHYIYRLAMASANADLIDI